MIWSPRPVGAFFLAAVLVVGACGGDDSGGAAITVDTTTVPTDPPATDPPATDPPATDPPATDPPATDPPATDPPATDPPATDPPATDPPATDPPATELEVAIFTSADLVDALPTQADLGPLWEDCDCDDQIIDPPEGEGFGVGNCGGPNAVARAVPNGLTGAVRGSAFLRDGGSASTAMYAFGDAAGAAQFLEDTFEVVNCDEVTWERIQRTESPGPDEYSGFGPGFEDVVDGQTWTFIEAAASDYLASPDRGADEVLLLAIEQDRELTAVGITFGQTRSTVSRYARYGNVVITSQMVGNYDYRGFLNLDDLVAFDPEFDDLDEFVDLVEPLMVERLDL